MTRLRKITEDDLEMIMNWRMSPEVTKYMNTDPVLTIEDQRRWFSSLHDDETSEYWLIVVDGTPAGVINLTDIDKDNRITSWAYYIGEKQCRFMLLAVSLEMSLYNYVFNVMNFDEVYADVFSLNKAVIRLHEICGCHVEREEKGKVVKNGIAYDVSRVSIKKKEWLKCEGSFTYEKINFDI